VKFFRHSVLPAILGRNWTTHF